MIDQKLQERVNQADVTAAFNNAIPLNRQVAAIKKYGSYDEVSKDRNKQNQILHDAKNEDLIAVDYLFLVHTGVIEKAFWKYYIGPVIGLEKASQRTADDFISMAYSMLANQSSPSPYNAFDSSKFSEEADLIKQFGYYFYRYLQAMSRKINDAEKNELNKTTSYEGRLLKAGDKAESEMASSDDFTEEVAVNDMLDNFTKLLKQEKPIRYSKILDLRRKGYSIQEISDKFGTTTVNIRLYLAKIKTMLQNFMENGTLKNNSQEEE